MLVSNSVLKEISEENIEYVRGPIKITFAENGDLNNFDWKELSQS